MKMGDKLIYHRTVFDFKSLKNLLEDIGMKNISIYDWRKTEHAQFDDHSQAYLPHFEKEKGVLISLNVESIKMSFEIIKKFENEIAEFYGAPYAVGVDSCTHAIELCLRYIKPQKIEIPVNTYLSVAFLGKTWHRMGLER